MWTLFPDLIYSEELTFIDYCFLSATVPSTIILVPSILMRTTEMALEKNSATIMEALA